MSESIRHSGSWWAPSSKHAKRTAVGTTAIVVALALITWAVWISPGNVVSTAVHHALGVKTQAQKTADATADAAKLQAKLTAAQHRIWKLEGQLQSANASGASRAERLASLQAQLKTAYAKLGTAESAASGGTTTASGSTSGGSGSASASNGSGGSGAAPAAAGSPAKASSTSTAAVAAPTKAEVLAQTARWYGLYTPQSPFNWADYDAIEQKVGTAANMAGYFQGFDQAFNATAVQRSWANGRLPVMTWETAPSQTGNDSPYIAGYSNADIINGNFDAYIKQYADAVKANGMPLVIRLDHEMNGSWYNWSENITSLPANERNATHSYTDMWKHVWTIFQNEGANADVIWDWSPTRIDNLSPNANSVKMTQGYLNEYYPGDPYVDWVGMSGYYRDASTPATFDETFARTLKQIRALPHTEGSKPIFLAEIGATETGGSIGSANAPSQKAAWITSLFDALAEPQNKDIIGFSYFDETATTIADGVRSTNDWRIDSRSDSLAAFTAGIARTDIDYDLQEVSK
ncbi:glycosyl hydrolase [Curtobacterium sp. MCBD17_003]|uniref:glycoside hydrolase family 26 protein n=1 Tax=Curtobacterium sp. MCBD17_003 TaxID=2175667 RepID=UPI000DA9B77B|nr:glycosyl hydrolase [Curtobacterium sp. MCBD17_003]WIE55977.1 glycosyl hydrolase [Curtobacterium sp. MCBD17_003]